MSYSSYVGQTLHNRYEIKSLIGEGSMGQVFQVWDRQARENRALKIMDTRKQRYPLESIFRFKTEAETLRDLNHPGIVRYFDFFQDQEIYGMVMELMEYPTLYQYLQTHHPLPFEQIWTIFEKLTEALVFVHERKKVHHDLKTSNMMILVQGNETELKLLDFGLAELVNGQENRVGGTLAYMAPEQTGILHKLIDHRADLYSLGVVLYEALTGKVPFQAPNTSALIHQHVAQPPTPPSQIREDTPPLLETFILRLLEKDPENRYRTTRGLWNDLQKFRRLTKDGDMEEVQFRLGEEDHWNILPQAPPFIGRVSEIEKILARIEQLLRHQQGGLLFIEGEDGVGKTRLLHEIHNQMQGEDRFCWFPELQQEDTETPYKFFRELGKHLVAYIRNTPEEGQAELIQFLTDKLQDKTDIFIELVPEFRAWYKEHMAKTKRSREDDYQQVIFTVLHDMLSMKVPLILILDNSQYLDPESLRFLVTYRKQWLESHILWVIASKPEKWPESLLQTFPVDEAKRVDMLRLEVLSATDFASLLQQYFSYHAFVLNPILDRLHDASQGNPAQLRNLLQTLIDHKGIVYKDAAWSIDRNKAEAEIQAFAEQQQTTLGTYGSFTEQEHHVLQRAAIFQHSFDFSALESVLAAAPKISLTSTELLDLLDRMVTNTVLSVDKNRKYVFRNSKMRLGLLRQMEGAVQQDCHRLIAQFLEKHFLATNPETIYDMVHHWGQSGDHLMAMDYALMAAEYARTSSFSLPKVTTYQSIAREHLNQLPKDTLSSERQFDIRYQNLMDSFLMARQGDVFWDEVKEMEVFVGSSRSRHVQCLSIKVQICSLQGRKKEMFEHAHDVLKIAKEPEDNEPLLYVYACMGLVASDYSFEDRLKFLDKSFELSKQVMKYDLLLGAMYIYIILLCHRCQFEKAQRVIQEFRELLTPLHMPLLEEFFLFIGTTIDRERGEFQNVLTAIDSIHETTSTKDFYQALTMSFGAYAELIIKLHLGIAKGMTGNTQEALTILEPMMEDKGKNEQHFERPQAILSRIQLALHTMNDPDTALTYLEKGFQHMGVRLDRFVLAQYHIYATWAYMQLMQFETAEQHLQNAEGIIKTLDTPLLEQHWNFVQYRLQWYQTHNKDMIQQAQDALQEMLELGMTGFYELYQDDLKTWRFQFEDSSSHSTFLSQDGTRDLMKLLQINRQISATLDLRNLFDRVLEGAMEISGAEHGYLFLCDEIDPMKVIEAPLTCLQSSRNSYGKPIEPEQQRFSSQIVKVVVENRRMIVIRDAKQEMRWKEDRMVQTHGLRSILAAPIILRQKFKGILYLCNRQASALFNLKDQEIVDMFTVQVATAINNAQIYEAEQKARKDQEATLKIFQRFVPQQFTKNLVEGDLSSLKAGLALQERMSILFSDIRAFTSISEKLTPKAVFAMLNEYLHEMEVPIRRNNGFVDKFIGDAIMALFDRSPLDAVRAAIGMQSALLQYNTWRKDRGEAPLITGIGIHTGEVTKGVVGSNERMDTTVIGDAVNTASRLESLTKHYNCDLLISDSTEAFLADHSDEFQYRKIDVLHLKGKAAPTVLFEVYNNDSPIMKEQKRRYQNLYEEAWEAYRQGIWPESIALFQNYLERFPEDQLAIVFLERCYRLRIQPPDDWDGTYSIEHK